MDLLSKTIGIIGGGQLGKMMILDAKRLGFSCITLDPTPSCPSHSISDEHIIADFNDEKAFERLAQKSDVITYEFEHIDSKLLLKLEKEGATIYPSPSALSIIQDKFSQNEKMNNAGIPIPVYQKIETEKELIDFLVCHENKGMLKSRLGGYDGKGNAYIASLDEANHAFKRLEGDKHLLMVEELIDFKMEISVLACRGIDGAVVTYPVAENRHIDSILDTTLVPANITEDAYKKAILIAERVMEVFDGVGMFCVEMFVTNNNDILVNEVAPRPHNSGHYTIEGTYTSQFEQHIRAITGLPLGSTRLIAPTVMKNLLGAEDSEGKTEVLGLIDAYKIPEVKVHIYGKTMSKAKRKMGHLTVSDRSLEIALKKAEEAYRLIKIQGRN